MQKKFICMQKDNYEKKYLSLETTNCLKGLFAVVVVVHHLYQRTAIIDNILLSVLFQAFGYLSVAIFFFFSGYGIAASTQKNGKAYVMTLPVKRMLPLYIDNAIMVMVYALLSILILGENISPGKVFTSFLWGGTVVKGGWYLQTILLLYTVYYIIFRVFKEAKAAAMFFMISLVCYCVLCVLLKLSFSWYEAVFAMPLGMWWLYHKEQIVVHLKKHYILSLIGCTVFFIFSFAGQILFSVKYIHILLKMLSAIGFVAVVMVLLFKISVNCKATRILGNYYFEIYIIQGVAMDLLHSRIIYIANDWLYCILCLVITMVLSVAIHPIFTFINKKFKEV